MDAKALHDALDAEIRSAGGTDRITFTVLAVAPELLDGLVGQRVEIAGVQRQAGRLPQLVLRTLDVSAGVSA